MKAFDYRYRFVIGTLACISAVPVAKADFLRAGRDAFLNYDFELAAENYDKYAKILRKSPDHAGEQLLDQYMRQLELAENSLENVQQIEVIDRIDVPAEDFFRHIKLPQSGGRLLPPDSNGLGKRGNRSDFAYSSESGDVMMWSENDTDHKEVIMQTERLMDGSWEKPHSAGTILNDGGNARNPFLLSDGLTLYFSSDGEGSMGGYDLFVASKDPASGEFRQPMGLGYPFNSPFNEYLMAIDEDNGIGWWVTDRNRIEGQVSVYVFRTNDVRKNYVMDEEDDIIVLARLDDISVTQNPDTDYNGILKGINQRSSQTKANSGGDFVFPLPGGKVARTLSDFSSTAAKRDMQQYLKQLHEYGELERKLSDLRRRFHTTDTRKSSSVAMRNEILDLEKKRDQELNLLKNMRNSIITSETNP